MYVFQPETARKLRRIPQAGTRPGAFVRMEPPLGHSWVRGEVLPTGVQFPVSFLKRYFFQGVDGKFSCVAAFLFGYTLEKKAVAFALL